MLALIPVLAMPMLGACDQQTPTADGPKASAPAPARAAPVTFERETDSFAFTYEYPPQAAALPTLKALLDAQRTQALAELEAQATEAKADAAGNDYPFNPHMMGVSWTVTGDTDALLAMIGEIGTFSGGAHGNANFEPLIWDKPGNRRVALEAVFTDFGAALAPLRQQYCDALNADRQEKRGEYIGESDDMFNTCPSFDDLAIVPYAGGDGGFDRLMFIAAPYVAGSYAEGAYEISLALPAATLAQVKSEYRSAFVIGAR
jgi:hypothetical protein